MDWEIRRYSAEKRKEWDEFVENSRNGVFMHKRAYMDYHSDRFNDCSLFAYCNGRLSALLPAEVSVEDGVRVLNSHRGLTYGGWIFPRKRIDGAEILMLFENMWVWLRDNGFGRLFYKPVPYIYTSSPSQEDEYALFRIGACKTMLNLSSSIYMPDPKGMNTNQRRHLVKGEALVKRLGMKIEEFENSELLIKIVNECLAERHGAVAVHSAAELALLKSRFEQNIRYFGVFRENELEAAVCVFDTGIVAHTQYIATTPFARANSLITVLMHEVMKRFPHVRWFDFGSSNLDGGKILNSSLCYHKFSLGGGGVLYPGYTLEVN